MLSSPPGAASKRGVMTVSWAVSLAQAVPTLAQILPAVGERLLAGFGEAAASTAAIASSGSSFASVRLRAAVRTVTLHAASKIVLGTKTHAPDLNLGRLQANVLPASRPTLPLSCLSSWLLPFPSASCHGLIGRASRRLISSLARTVTNHTTLDMNSVLAVEPSDSRAYCSHSLLMLLRCMPYRPVQGQSADLNSMFWIVAAVKHCDFFMTSTLQAIGRSKLNAPI